MFFIFTSECLELGVLPFSRRNLSVVVAAKVTMEKWAMNDPMVAAVFFVNSLSSYKRFDSINAARLRLILLCKWEY